MALILSSLFILAHCAHRYNCSTYQEVIEVTCGKWFGIATELCVILYMFGTCIAMLVIIGDQFDEGRALLTSYYRITAKLAESANPLFLMTQKSVAQLCRVRNTTCTSV